MIIEKAGIIGAGTMGKGIATLLAQKGIQVILLDIATPSIEDNPDDLIQTGNVTDDFEALSDCDWVIEVIIEKLQPKRDLMARLQSTCKPGAIITSNTSGIPISNIASECSNSFKTRFLGTHFFNPPTLMKLLEIIPADDSDPEIVAFMQDFGENVLGKGIILCKDTPNFIANRIGTMTSAYAMQEALKTGFPVAKIDLLIGELIGRPKSGLLRLGDIIGHDIRAGIMANLYDKIPGDNFREILHDADLLALYDYTISNNLRGNKDGKGFYKKVILEDGTREFWTLNLNTYEYEAPQKVDAGGVGQFQNINSLPERLNAILEHESPESDFIRKIVYDLLSYAVTVAPDIAHSIADIDNALRWGFNHQMGAFELWDALGFQETISHMEAHGFFVPDYVHEMLESGKIGFYPAS